MSKVIGVAGRQARQLALGQKTNLIGRAMHLDTFSSQTNPLPLVQRAQTESNETVTAAEGTDGPSPGSSQAQAAVKRETRSPSPEEIADRVYELLREGYRQGRER